ncbi:hypothetical protein MtrunA17_Chr2g0312741 [Medicago truncatula]|uniref:Uncharacterized protein n=1 Tax=Medicago truncatula TaxID=3880 RepID=A0A396JE42_MEDTR|nr:hypothetical protein MtrunA17_Chr2g0312741 [Medicago truncatula]
MLLRQDIKYYPIFHGNDFLIQSLEKSNMCRKINSRLHLKK